MGTSSSSDGRSGSNPIVPAWADADPESPLPVPEGRPFQTFRTEFGRWASGGGDGGEATLRSALGHFARTSTGGSNYGPRRFGPAYKAGGSLYGLLGDMQSGGNGAAVAGVDLSGLVGKPLDYAAQEIARLLAPANADADRVTAAIQEAIAEALPDVEIFDPTSLSQDQLIAVMIEFLSRILFQQVVEDAASAWNKAPTAARTVEAEGQLLDLIKTAVDKHLSPSLAQTSKPLPAAQVERRQRQAMDEVWREWEAYS
jgi:hypothetical protein